MAEEQLRKAFTLMKQGEKKQASQIVQAVLKQDRDNLTAWWLMANLLDNPERQKKALDRVLAINPLHKGAVKMMAALERGETAGYETKAVREKAKPEQEVLTTQEIEFDWSKLEAIDAKGKETPKMDENRAAKIGGYLMVGFAVIIVLVVVIFTGIPAIQDAMRTQPDEVVLNFYQSFLGGNFDEARVYVCSDKLETYDSLVDGASNVFGEARWDFSGVAAEIIEKNSETSTVQLSGEISITINDSTETFTMEELAENTGDNTLEALKLEDGQWCIAQIGE